MNQLSIVRKVVPIRPLSVPEAYALVELQAAKLIATGGLLGPPVPETLITNLPGVQVEQVRPLAVSGESRYRHGRWLILLNADDSRNRQRFSLAHELKHALDGPLAETLYPATAVMSVWQQIERICNAFAAALLIPVMWLKRAWRAGIQQVADLARLFEVSQTAMTRRLVQVGLMELPVPQRTPIIQGGII